MARYTIMTKPGRKDAFIKDMAKYAEEHKVKITIYHEEDDPDLLHVILETNEEN